MNESDRAASSDPPRSVTIHDPARLRQAVGTELFVTEWTVITQEVIDRFAQATGDFQWIHVDVARARKESPFGTTIAHGFLTLSLLAKFYNEGFHPAFARMGLNYGLNRVRFITPVKAGSRLRGRFRLEGVDDIAGGVQLRWLATAEIEGEARPACVAEFINREYFAEGSS